MSVIGKKPFVNDILDSCSSDQVRSVLSLLDNLGSTSTVSLFGVENLISSDNIGVSHVILKLEEVSNKNVEGILVYTDSDHCGLFAFDANSGVMSEFKIDPVNKLYWQLYEHLTVEELRQVCGDRVADVEIDDDVPNYFEVSNIQNISKAILDELKPGDIVAKKTGNQKHTYVVSYKGDGAGEGICLTYCAAGYTETVSYDRSGNNWVYNSTDVVTIPTLPTIQEMLAEIAGYDAHKVQTLKNAGEGLFAWVDDE